MTKANAVSPQATPQIEVWGATDVGRTREGNEDSIFPDSTGQGGFVYNPRPDTLARKGQLLIVADGVGGAQGGREASQWAIQRAVERYYDLPGADLGADLLAAVSYANASLVEHLQHQRMPEAGCTMTAAVIHGMALYIANVGDSRTYLIRGGQAYPLTKDHTLTQQKIDQRQLRPEDAHLDPDKSVLTRSMGATAAVQVDLFRQTLQPGDRVLLCSDGLHDMVSDAEIARGAISGPPKRATTRLIAEANRRGGFDNISVVLAQVGNGAGPAGGGWLANMIQTWSGLSMKQRGVLLTMAIVLALVVISLFVWIGWTMFGGRDIGDKTSTPVAVQTTPASMPKEYSPSPSPTLRTISTTTAPTVTPEQGTSITASNPTATLAPTKTPTNTPIPPTKRPTSTATPTVTPSVETPTSPPGGTTMPPATEVPPTTEVPPATNPLPPTPGGDAG